MSNNFCRTPNINLFRGAAHDLGMSRIILPSGAKIFVNLPHFAPGLPRFATLCHTRRDLSIDLFCAIVQKVLDNRIATVL